MALANSIMVWPRASRLGQCWRSCLKAKIHYTSFPVASPQQVCNKLARAKVRCVCCVVSFLKFHYNDLLPTSWLLHHRRGNYGETCEMDFGHYTVDCRRCHDAADFLTTASADQCWKMASKNLGFYVKKLLKTSKSKIWLLGFFIFGQILYRSHYFRILILICDFCYNLQKTM